MTCTGICPTCKNPIDDHRRVGNFFLCGLDKRPEAPKDTK